MLLTALNNFLQLCRSRKTFAILSFLSFAFASLSFLVLTEKSMYVYQNNMKNEYLFVEATTSNDIVAIYQDLVNDESIFEIDSISLIDAQYTGIYFDSSKYQMFMPYGRLFSQEECMNERKVALLSLEYVRNLPEEKASDIWANGVDVDGSHYDVIGGYTDIAKYFPLHDLARDFPLPTLMAFPAKTYLAMGNKPKMLNCHFSTILSKEQQAFLMQLVTSRGSVVDFYIPGTNGAFQTTLYETLSSYCAILLMSLIAVISIIVYWFQNELTRYRIYMIYGARKYQIFFFCSVDMLLFSLVAYIGALGGLAGINAWFEGVILARLPATWYVLIGIGIIGFSWFVVTVCSFSSLRKHRNTSLLEVA